MDMGKFRKVDEIWGEWFEEPWPVSTCVQVSVGSYLFSLVPLWVVDEG